MILDNSRGSEVTWRTKAAPKAAGSGPEAAVTPLGGGELNCEWKG